MNRLEAIKHRFRQFRTIVSPKYKRKLALLLILLVLNSLLEFLGLSFFIPIISMLISGKSLVPWISIGALDDQSLLLVFCGIIVGFFIIRIFIFSWIWKYQLKLTYNIFIDISEKIIERIYGKGFVFVNQKNPNSLINDFYSVPNLFVLKVIVPTLVLLNELLVITFIAGALLYFYWKLILYIFLLVTPIMYLLFSFYKKRLSKQTKEMTLLSPRLWDSFFDLINGFIDVKVSGNEKHFKEVARNKMVAYSERAISRSYFDFLPNKVLEFLLIVGMVSIILWGKLSGQDNANLLTVLGTFSIAFYRIFPSVNKIVMSTMDVRANMFTTDEIYQYLENETSHLSATQQEVTFTNKIVFNNVDFSYGTRKILDNLNVTIAKQQITGFIGPSGSGKSTLVFMLTGFLRPDAGNLMIDEVPLDKQNNEAWLKKVGYVKQDVYISENSLVENITFGSQYNSGNYMRAVELAGAAEFIDRLPEKEKTIIGEKGVRLSGGQKQRIGIARAIYHGAELLVFDEATSALDPEAEKVINDSVQVLKEAGYTIVIIAHRYTSLQNTDVIYELVSGRVTRQLNYKQLIDMQ